MSGLILTVAAVSGAIPLLMEMSALLTTVYIICLIVGGGLLLISTVLGGHGDTAVDHPLDADAGFHVDADVAVDADVTAGADVGGELHAPDGYAAHEALSLASWFSIRFLVYFVAVFGLVGTVLSCTTSVGTLHVLLVAVGSGLVAGQGVHQTLRYLQRTSGDSTTRVRDYVDKSARVTVAVRPGQRGEVALQVCGRERYVAAVARHGDDQFNVGDRVGIMAFANGTAEVVSQEEFDFLRESEPGEES